MSGIVLERLMDIGVGGGVPAKDAAETWDHPFQVAKVPEADEAAGRFSEVEYQQFSAGLGDAVHLGEATLKVSEVAQACPEAFPSLRRVGRVGVEPAWRPTMPPNEPAAEQYEERVYLPDYPPD